MSIELPLGEVALRLLPWNSDSGSRGCQTLRTVKEAVVGLNVSYLSLVPARNINTVTCGSTGDKVY